MKPVPASNRHFLRSSERSLFGSGHPDYELRPSAAPKVRIALLYPNSYSIGMSSLGYQLAWRTIQSHAGCAAGRFFMDTLAEGSIETGEPLSEHDVIAFSATYEMDEPNILAAIEAAGLPLLAMERGVGARSGPLVLVGGVLVSVNRLPLFPFADAFVHGDAEIVLPPILDALAACADARARWSDRLRALAGLPGVELTPGAGVAAGIDDGEVEDAFVQPPAIGRASATPHLNRMAPAAVVVENLDRPPCATQILSPHTEFSDMVLVDLARGCPHHCTFCWIGHNTPPYRQRTVETLIRAIEPWIPLTDRFGLVSSAVGAHGQIDEICRWMMSRGLRVSYSSLRVEEVTPVMLEALAAGGQKGITIAPEAGNGRVRRLLGKRITDEEILDVTARAMSLGIENVKQYFMTGIPSETDDEALDIARFTERVREMMLHWARPRGRMGHLAVNLGVYVPKPNLPLNHIEPPALDDVKRRLKKVVKALGRIPNVQVNVSSPELAAAQTVLAVGGAEASAYLMAVRASSGDWRAANRAWRACAESDFARRKIQSRTAAAVLHSKHEPAIHP